MIRLKQFLLPVLSTVLVLTIPIQSSLVSAYLDLNAGYRRDTLSAHICTLDERDRIIAKEHLEVKELQLYQIGAKGQALICDCFVRGEAYWGYSDSGIYRKVSKITRYDPVKNRGDLRKGRTKDFSIGAGYYLNFCDLIAIGPSAGWSYQKQQFDVKKNVFKTDSKRASASVQYSNQWQGPWLGWDAQFQLLGFNCRGGYSYHWADWNADWRLKHQQLEWVEVPEKQKAKDAHGQLVYLDLLWGFCPFVEMGVGFKWQYWHATKGKGKFKKSPLKSDEGNGLKKSSVDRLKRVDWNSYVVSVDLGISF